MSGTKFVPIIPGAVDDLGAKHGLSRDARSLLLWLATTADRETGDLYPVTISAISEATAFNWRAVRRALDELRDVGAIEELLPRGHNGYVRLLWHKQIVWKRGARSRAPAHRSRAPAHGSRGSADRSRGGAGANRENAQREKKNESSSNSLDAAPSAAPPDGRAAGAADGSVPIGIDKHSNRIYEPPTRGWTKNGTPVWEDYDLCCSECGEPTGHLASGHQAPVTCTACMEKQGYVIKDGAWQRASVPGPT
jgi:hypothetical protein